MKRLTLCVALLCAAPATQAAESLTELEMLGRFARLEKAAQAKLSVVRERSTSLLAPLCIAYSKLKRYNKLFPCLDELEKRIASGDWEIDTDKSMISNSDATPLPSTLRAEALLETGEYLRAVSESQRALEVLQDRKSAGVWPPTKYRLLNLGTIAVAYAMSGDKENATRQAKVLENFSYPFIGNAGWRPMKAYAIARVHMALGNYAAALPYVNRDDWFPWSLGNLGWGFSGTDSAETFLMLPKLLMRGKCQFETGDLASARAALNAVLQHPRIAEFGELYWVALFERGRIAEMESNRSKAIDFYRRAVEIVEVQRASINTEANKIGFVGDKQQVYGRLVSALVADGQAVPAFEYVERSKARSLVDLLASRKDFTVPSVDAGKARELLAQLDVADRTSWEQDLAEPPGQSPAMRSLQLVRQELRQAAPETYSLVTVTSVPSDELRALVGEGEVLLEYYYHDKDLYAFVIDRERLRVTRLGATGLAADVQALRHALEDHATPAWQEPARKLYERLWRPVESAVGSKSVIVVAHGALHYLPFAALQNAESRFLIDQNGLRFLPSASVLKFLRPAQAKKDQLLLVLGNPDLGDPKLDLQFAESEARAVSGLYPGARTLLRKEASETNFKKTGAVFSRIHFATHGKFQADNPLNSGLYLAKDEENDGVLTAGELYSMTLDADLVTLSACETGLGKIANGDDVVGLTRGFLYAGSRSIVASLWSVEDRATAELMKTFYENLARLPKLHALREAQLKTRESFPHPFFWAAFQLTGRGD